MNLPVPSRLAATATASATALPDACFQSTPSLPPPPPPTAATNPTGNHTGQPVALCDFLARRLHAAIAAASPAASSHGIRSDYDSEAVGQFVLETNRAAVSAATGAVSVVFEVLPARGGGGGGARQLCGGAQEQQQDRGRGAEMAEVLRGIVKQALLGSVHPGGGLDAAAARAHVEVCTRCTHCSHEAYVSPIMTKFLVPLHGKQVCRNPRVYFFMTRDHASLVAPSRRHPERSKRTVLRGAGEHPHPA